MIHVEWIPSVAKNVPSIPRWMENEIRIVQDELSKRFRGYKASSNKGEEKRNGNQSRQSLNPRGRKPPPRSSTRNFLALRFYIHPASYPLLIRQSPSWQKACLSPSLPPSLLVETVFSNASSPLQPRRIIAVLPCVKISLARLEIYFYGHCLREEETQVSLFRREFIFWKRWFWHNYWINVFF